MTVELLTTDDVAALVRLSAETIRDAIRDGDLKASKLRGQWRIHPDDLATWLDNGRAQQVQHIMSRTEWAGSAPPPSHGPRPVGRKQAPVGSARAALRARREAA